MSADSALSRDPIFLADQPVLSRLEYALIAVTSVLLLIPCFWMGHIEAGDLSSHVYNAWLATQIQSGAAPGLAVVHVWTNMLSDVGLEFFLRRLGPAGAERVVTAASVLIFYWGVFALVSAATARRPWLLAPSIGMLTYGLIFQMGFLNFYLATGLGAWAMALLWTPSRKRILAAGLILVLAFLAHPLPVAWAACAMLYIQLSRRLPPGSVKWMLLAGVALVAVFQALLMNWFPSRWSLAGVLSLNGMAGITGVEQVWLFGSRYMAVAAGLLFLWGVLFLQRIDKGKFISDPVAQLWMLHMLAFVVLPSAIQFPQYQHVLAYIPQRISLLSVIFFFMTVGGAAYGRGVTRASGIVALTFFVFVYLDDRAFTLFETRLADLVQPLPPGQRVVASIDDTGTRVNGASHMLDFACIGHCFSYANYEPATAQFRIRIAAPTRVVAPNMQVVQDIEDGVHVVSPQEAPLYSVCMNENEGSLYLKPLKAGEKMCKIETAISPRLQ